MSTLMWGFTPTCEQNRVGLALGRTTGGYRTQRNSSTPETRGGGAGS